MGAVFAAAARAPITAVLIVFELTGEYSVILPLMIAVVAATSTSSRLSRDTIYTLKLRRRGIRIDHPRVPSVMRTSTLQSALEGLPPALSPEASEDDIVDALVSSASDSLPVVGPDGTLSGVVGLSDVEREAGESDVSAQSMARVPPVLRISDTLESAAEALSRYTDDGLPVLAHDHDEVVGWVTHRSVLRAYHEARRALSGEVATELHAGAPAPEPSGPPGQGD